jgi:uncharacterized protein
VTSGPGLWELLIGAFALMLVAEGLLPFVSPPKWRAVFEQALKLTDGQIRFVALASMLSGLGLLYIFLA